MMKTAYMATEYALFEMASWFCFCVVAWLMQPMRMKQRYYESVVPAWVWHMAFLPGHLLYSYRREILAMNYREWH
jgi:hypothetical protein